MSGKTETVKNEDAWEMIQAEFSSVHGQTYLHLQNP